MRYLVDIDGTVLTQESPGYYHRARPLKNAVEGVNMLFDAGHQVVFYTSRNYKYMQMTIKQLKDFGFKFHHVCFAKPHADKIIDDKAMQVFDLLEFAKKEGMIEWIAKLKE